MSVLGEDSENDSNFEESEGSDEDFAVRKGKAREKKKKAVQRKPAVEKEKQSKQKKETSGKPAPKLVIFLSPVCCVSRSSPLSPAIFC